MTLNNIVKRCKTHIIQKLRTDYQVQVDKYFQEIEQMREKYKDNLIFVNFDEVPVFYDLGKDYPSL